MTKLKHTNKQTHSQIGSTIKNSHHQILNCQCPILYQRSIGDLIFLKMYHSLVLIHVYWRSLLLSCLTHEQLWIATIMSLLCFYVITTEMLYLRFFKHFCLLSSSSVTWDWPSDPSSPWPSSILLSWPWLNDPSWESWVSVWRESNSTLPNNSQF